LRKKGFEFQMKLKVVRKKRQEEGGKKTRENWGFWKSSGTTKI
jgi:hypothetical protein